jgi:hypothetical protein
MTAPLFRGEVVTGTTDSFNQRSLDTPPHNPQNWMWSQGSRAPFPGEKPETTARRALNLHLTTPAPLLVHPQLAIPAERTRERPGLQQFGCSYCSKLWEGRGRMRASIDIGNFDDFLHDKH